VRFHPSILLRVLDCQLLMGRYASRGYRNKRVFFHNVEKPHLHLHWKDGTWRFFDSNTSISPTLYEATGNNTLPPQGGWVAITASGEDAVPMLVLENTCSPKVHDSVVHARSRVAGKVLEDDASSEKPLHVQWDGQPGPVWEDHVDVRLHKFTRGDTVRVDGDEFAGMVIACSDHEDQPQFLVRDWRCEGGESVWYSQDELVHVAPPEPTNLTLASIVAVNGKNIKNHEDFSAAHMHQPGQQISVLIRRLYDKGLQESRTTLMQQIRQKHHELTPIEVVNKTFHTLYDVVYTEYNITVGQFKSGPILGQALVAGSSMALPTQNTFVHFPALSDADSQSSPKRASSAPPRLRTPRKGKGHSDMDRKYNKLKKKALKHIRRDDPHDFVFFEVSKMARDLEIPEEEISQRVCTALQQAYASHSSSSSSAWHHPTMPMVPIMLCPVNMCFALGSTSAPMPGSWNCSFVQ